MTDSTANLKIEKTHCPSCDGERKCFVHGTTYKTWDHEDGRGNGSSGGISHTLLECCGCEIVFYQKSSWSTEECDWYVDQNGGTQGDPIYTKKTYPAPDKKNRPQWFTRLFSVDEQLLRIMAQTYVAYDGGAYILAAVGLRTALDRATEVLKIDPAISFEEKLDALKNGGYIGDAERSVLTVVTNAGNAAAHRGWSPGLQELNQLIAAMEVFLHRSFIVGTSALDLANSIPEKPKRRPKGSKAGTGPNPE